MVAALERLGSAKVTDRRFRLFGFALREAEVGVPAPNFAPRAQVREVARASLGENVRRPARIAAPRTVGVDHLCVFRHDLHRVTQAAALRREAAECT